MKDFAKRLDALTHNNYKRTRSLLMSRLGWSRSMLSMRRRLEKFSFAELQLLAYTFNCTLEDLENINIPLYPDLFRWEDEPVTQQQTLTH